jgi:hypothetical protein
MLKADREGAMKKGAWADQAVPGAEFALRVTPGARQAGLTAGPEGLRCTVTAPPEDGRANRAVAELLAHALGVAKSRLTLVRGATSRDKLFRLDP